ncbi:MAG: tRNA 2-thiouridine(34) synthase MnmA [Spirochaetia bacterium]|nr:tRNA 2-thiouridine(34) synthase MnmA [Spirochaetia bacterium]
MNRTKDSKIILALSGGIDSGMAVRKLKEDGWKNIIAANHVVYRGVKSSSREVLERAEKLCRDEEIPFYIIDAEKEFAGCVINNFIESYAHGVTPNPCVICNENIKFTWFYDSVVNRLIEEGKASAVEDIFFATGHYVRLAEKDGDIFLRRASDKTKDQSYMLYRLPQKILRRCVFPMGEILKKDLASEAADLGYSFDSVKESQDICFIEGEYGNFIREKAPPNLLKVRPGRIEDTYGNFLGRHKGYVYYTVGQRKGLSLSDGPWYVISVDSKTNTVTVGRDEEQGRDDFYIEKSNWFIPVPVNGKISCNVVIRYNSSEIPCEVEITGLGSDSGCGSGSNSSNSSNSSSNSSNSSGSVKVTLSAKQVITPGQSAVFYKDDLVIGGGIICRS